MLDEVCTLVFNQDAIIFHLFMSKYPFITISLWDILVSWGWLLYFKHNLIIIVIDNLTIEIYRYFSPGNKKLPTLSWVYIVNR
jgi:hypothetical protein